MAGAQKPVFKDPGFVKMGLNLENKRGGGQLG